MPLKDPIKRREYEKNRMKNKRNTNQEFKEKTNQYTRNNIKKRAKDRYDFINKFKDKCIHCGESRQICLDFHHTNPTKKEFNIIQMAHNGYSVDIILKELEKCVILCANCHRIEHERLKNIKEGEKECL